jgi:hypothetical protein
MKVTAAVLWIAVLGILILGCTEGRKLRVMHAKYAALEADRSALEAQLAERLRNRRHTVAFRPSPSEKFKLTTGAESTFAAAPLLVESFLAELPSASRDAYGTPEHLLALFMASDPPAAVQLYSIEPSNVPPPPGRGVAAIPGAIRVNVVALTRSPAGQSGFLTYTFQQTEDGWQMTTPNLPTGGIRAYLAKIANPDPTAN